MRITRVAKSTLTAMLIVVGLTAACTAQSDTLGLMSWQFAEPGYDVFWKESMDAFSRENPGAAIREVHYPYEIIFDRLNMLVAGGSAPCLVELTGFNVFQFAAMGALEPLDKYLAQSDLTLALSEYDYATYDGQIYALPLSSRTLQLIVNRQLFEEAGLQPPTSMEEMLEVAKELTVPSKGQYGLTAVTSQGTLLYEFLLVWTAGLGGHFAEDGQPTLNTQTTREALEFVKELFDAGVMPKGLRDAGASRAYFLTGQAAMIIDGPWFFSTIADQAPQLLDHVEALPMPTPTRAATGGINNVIAISRDCENKDLAWKYLEMLASQEWAERWVSLTGSLSARTGSVPEDYLLERPWFRTYAEEATNAVQVAPPGLEEYFEQVVKLLTSRVEQVLYQNYPISEALAAAQAEAEQLITR